MESQQDACYWLRGSLTRGDFSGVLLASVSLREALESPALFVKATLSLEDS